MILMYKNAINFILILTGILFFIRCSHPNTYSFSDHEHWVYNSGDTLIFTGDLGTKDSFLVHDLLRYFDTRVTSVEDKDKYEYQEYSLDEIKQIKGRRIWMNRFIKPTYFNEINRIDFTDSAGYIQYWLYPALGNSVGNADSIFNEKTIADKVYKNVYYYSINAFPKPLKRIYLNHTYGLLQYDYNNQTWRLSEIKPER